MPVYSGVIIDMNTEEIDETVLGKLHPILNNFRIVNVNHISHH